MPKHIDLIHSVEEMVRLRDQPVQFANQLAVLHGSIKELASARGEYGKISLEVMFYRGQFFYYSLIFYVLSFILVALSWLKPKSMLLQRSIQGSVAFATVFLVVGIVIRCVIRSRPPVSTLYETILFITAVTVIVTFVI